MTFLDCISVANMRESDRKTIESRVPGLTPYLDTRIIDTRDVTYGGAQP